MPSASTKPGSDGSSADVFSRHSDTSSALSSAATTAARDFLSVTPFSNRLTSALRFLPPPAGLADSTPRFCMVVLGFTLGSSSCCDSWHSNTY